MKLDSATIIAKRSSKTVYRDGNRSIKVFEPTFSVADVLNEALNLARVGEGTTLNIPRLQEVTTIDGKWAIVYDYIEGRSLTDLMLSYPEKFIGTEDYERYDFFRKFVNRVIERDTVFSGDGPYDVEFLCLADLAQGHYGAVGNGYGSVRDDRIHIHIDDDSEALAVRAISLRRVERERVRSWFREGDSCIRADEML